jgi:methionyl aminopeptidase
MDNTIYDKYKKAGKIAAESRKYGINLIKPGIQLLDVANRIESYIVEKGACLAFPVNISINEIAAHFSPRHDTNQVFKKGNIVKLDIGAHIDGYIADTAVTIEVGTTAYSDMIKSSKDALDKALSVVKAGIDLSEIGKIVEDTITSYGYKPITNLSGHSVEQYELHSGISIPNVSNNHSTIKPKEGDVLAIEPFATNGEGRVLSGKGSNIYLCNKSFKSKLIRDKKSKQIYDTLRAGFKTLPFAQRWCKELHPNCNDITLKKLSFLGLVKHYPQLIEAKGGMVTQAEHTIIIQEDGCEITT